MWEAPQVPNPKTDPEMAPIYRAQDDWPHHFPSHVGFGTPSNRGLHVRIQAEQITRVIFILDFHQAAIVPEVVHVHHAL